jgi:predicted esterase
MAIEQLNIETPTHGRVLVQRPVGESSATVVAFHGYAQSADDLMAELTRTPGSECWTLLSVQALNRFYTRGDQHIVASWMTRQDRELAIADNIEYVNRVFESIAATLKLGPTYCVGFSQGVAMAYRAGTLGRHRVDGIIAVGGDVPPDCKPVPADRWPRVLIAAGDADHWFTPEKVVADESFLRGHGVAHDVFRYPAGHVFTDDVRSRIAAFINS